MVSHMFVSRAVMYESFDLLCEISVHNEKMNGRKNVLGQTNSAFRQLRCLCNIISLSKTMNDKDQITTGWFLVD